jgi:hypothetical protein
MRLLRIVVAVAVLVGGLVMTSPVDARRKFPSQIRNVRAHEEGDVIFAISGRVASRAARCLGGRLIRIVETATGVGYGSTLTDSAGNWVVEGLGPEDVIYKISLRATARCDGDTVAVELG